jgi:drug/metabolite transporter (DMT)-like permease
MGLDTGPVAPSRPAIAAATAIAMVAFASNSILCRLALGGETIDPVGFTTIRLGAGAITLLAIAVAGGRRRSRAQRGSWMSALALFGYAIGFSLAYVRLDAGTGALILFGFVQVTMIVAALVGGERPVARQWAGLVAAVGGLAYLVAPGLTAPSPAGSALMAGAGVAWGVYSLRGRGESDPLISTTDNFVRSVPLVLVVAVASLGRLDVSPRGAAIAVASGALASGVGYVLWYSALRGLTATGAATVQLTVPVIAAVGGVLFLSEAVTVRLVVASVLVLGGVAAVLRGSPQT